MRTKLLAAALTICAIGVLWAGVAGASAATVSFLDQAGNPLPVGATVVAKTPNTRQLWSPAGEVTCLTAEVTTKVGANNASPATLTSLSPKFSECLLWGGVGKYQYIMSNIKMPGSVEFLPGAPLNGTTNGFWFEFDYTVLSLGLKCHAQGLIGASWASFGQLFGEGTLTGSGANCPARTTFIAPFRLYDGAGQLIKIVTNP